MLSLTLTRTSLSLADLVIDSDPFSGSFHLPEDGIEWPRFDTRRTYAPPSEFVAGRVLLSAVPDVGAMTTTIYARGTDAATLKAAKAELEAAVSQFSYTLTLTENGQSWTWTAQPELPSWGQVDTGMVRAFMAKATVVIPLNPEGS